MWNLEGIAESVYEEMVEEGAGEDELEYYLRRAYYSVFSRDIDSAETVMAEVRPIVMEKLDMIEQDAV